MGYKLWQLFERHCVPMGYTTSGQFFLGTHPSVFGKTHDGTGWTTISDHYLPQLYSTFKEYRLFSEGEHRPASYVCMWEAVMQTFCTHIQNPNVDNTPSEGENPPHLYLRWQLHIDRLEKQYEGTGITRVNDITSSGNSLWRNVSWVLALIFATDTWNIPYATRKFEDSNFHHEIMYAVKLNLQHLVRRLNNQTITFTRASGHPNGSWSSVQHTNRTETATTMMTSLGTRVFEYPTDVNAILLQVKRMKDRMKRGVVCTHEARRRRQKTMWLDEFVVIHRLIYYFSTHGPEDFVNVDLGDEDVKQHKGQGVKLKIPFYGMKWQKFLVFKTLPNGKRILDWKGRDHHTVLCPNHCF